MLLRWCTLLAFAALVVFTGCGGGSVSQDINSQNNGGGRDLSAVTNLYATELIAGAGQGWPGSGTDVGEVSVWQDGDTLTVKYELISGFVFSQEGGANLHLFISESWPPTLGNGNPTVAPGAFPYSATVPGTDSSYEFQFSMSDEGWTSGDTLYIAAHAVVCDDEGDGGDGGEGGDGYYTYEICDGAYDPPAVVTIWAGQSINAGTATYSISNDGNFLVVDIETIDGWEICQDHLWVGTTPNGYPQTASGAPKLGLFPYQHDFGGPPNPTTDQFMVPLSDIDGFAWSGDIAEICAVLHLTVCRGDNGEGGYVETQTGFAWFPGEDDFPSKRWGGAYCMSICREWHYNEPPPPGGGSGCQTAWAFELDGNLLNNDGSQIGDGVSENEEGWFPNLGFTRWGWRIIYGVQ